MSERKPGGAVAAALGEGVEAGRLYKVLSRSYVVLAGALVVLSFFVSTDDEAVLRLEYGSSVAHYDSGNLWSMFAEGTNLGVFGVLFMLVMTACAVVAACRRTIPRRPGLDLTIAAVAALYLVLLVTKPDYLDEAEPELLLPGQLTVAVLAAAAALGVVLEALAWSPGRRS